MNSRSPVLPVTLLALGILVGLGSGRAPASPLAAGEQHSQRFTGKIQRKVAYDYLLFLPTGYDARATTRWPLIVFLHGAGERGTNVQLVATHGPPMLVQQRPDFPFVVLSPQCPEGQFWDVEALELFLKTVTSRLAIDPRRIYLTGLSMGGNGSWNWSMTHPEHFAAVAPICGWGDPIRLRLGSAARQERLKKLPIWAFHGGRDTVVPPHGSEMMIEAYKRLGNTPKLTVYPEAGHDSWTEAYHDPALFDWFLQQRLP